MTANLQAGSTRDVLGLARLQDQAEVQLQAGNLAQAAQLLHQVLQASPQNATALCAVARLALMRNDPEAAVAAAQEAVRHAPKSPHCQVALGRALRSADRSEEAVSAYRRALRLDPARADVLVSLGIALRTLGRLDEAETAYRRASLLAPTLAETHHNLGNLLLKRGKLDEAEASFRRAIELRPNLGEAWYELGNLARLRGPGSEAARECYGRAVAATPAHANSWDALAEIELAERNWRAAHDAYRTAASTGRAESSELAAAVLDLAIRMQEARRTAEADSLLVHCVPGFRDDGRRLAALGIRLRELRHPAEAGAALQRAVEREPNLDVVHVELGNVHFDLGRFGDAAACYRQAIALTPEQPIAHNNLSNTLRLLGDIDGALAHASRATEIDPVMPNAWLNLANAHLEMGEADNAIGLYDKAIELEPGHDGAVCNRLLVLNYSDRWHFADVAAAHMEFGRQWQALHPAAEWSGTQAAAGGQRRLRIGYISGDLRQHAVASFLRPVLESHDRSRFELFAYYTHALADDVTAQLRTSFDAWADVARLDDDALCARIRADGIDILVDLSIYTMGSRILALARKPAPIQVNWLGYLLTSGLPSFDYRITDQRVDPPGYEQWQTEQPLRLPGAYLCFGAPKDAPDVTPLPEGPVVFGSFNNLPKLTDTTVSLWSRVLNAVPGSQLMMKSKALGSPGARSRLAQRFAAHGVAAERLLVRGWEGAVRGHLELYEGMHVALDTWPYNGVTTTCEALWMGVPVVSLVGESQASRQGLTILEAVGLGELAATSEAEFVERAVALAADRRALANLRNGLRARVAASPLCDGPGFTARLEAAYLAAWQACCAQRPSRHS